MMTRSIVGRFLILAVLLVSLGVIAQAALMITRGPGKAIAKTNAPQPGSPAAMASATPAPMPSNGEAARAATQAGPVAVAASAQQIGQQVDAPPVRVVYPGPLGDTPIQPRRLAAAAPSPVVPSPIAPTPGVPTPAIPTPAEPQVAVEAAPAPPIAAVSAPAKPLPASSPPASASSPVVVASADAGSQPTLDPAVPAAKGNIDLNSASVEALNHLGGGHIGQAIVKHRPYGSIEDLVKKKVVRRSVFEQIKDQLAAQ